MSRIKVISARNLESAAISDIISRIRAKAGDDVEINIEIDPDLVGGIVIQEDDILFDGSIRHQLDRIKRHLGR